jgi:hypothetical protein
VFVDGFKEHVLCRLVAEQKAALATKKRCAQRLVVVFDDVAYDREFKQSQCVSDLFYNCRHFNTAVMVSSQSGGATVPVFQRHMTDFTFYFPAHSRATNKYMHQHYFGQVRTLKQFSYMCAQLKKNEALVSDNCCRYASQQTVTKYRAECSSLPTLGATNAAALFETSKYQSLDQCGLATTAPCFDWPLLYDEQTSFENIDWETVFKDAQTPPAMEFDFASNDAANTSEQFNQHSEAVETASGTSELFTDFSANLWPTFSLLNSSNRDFFHRACITGPNGRLGARRVPGLLDTRKLVQYTCAV